MRYCGNLDLLQVIFASSSKTRYNGFKGQDLEWNINLSKIKAKKSNFEVELDTMSIFAVQPIY